MDRRALEIGLAGVQAKVEALENELDQTKKAAQSFERALRDLESRESPVRSGRKRVPKGFPRDAILKVLVDNRMDWTEIQREIKREYNINLNRATILNNLRRLTRKTKDAQKETVTLEDGKWSIRESPVKLVRILDEEDIEREEDEMDEDET